MSLDARLFSPEVTVEFEDVVVGRIATFGLPCPHWEIRFVLPHGLSRISRTECLAQDQSTGSGRQYVQARSCSSP